MIWGKILTILAGMVQIFLAIREKQKADEAVEKAEAERKEVANEIIKKAEEIRDHDIDNNYLVSPANRVQDPHNHD